MHLPAHTDTQQNSERHTPGSHEHISNMNCYTKEHCPSYINGSMKSVRKSVTVCRVSACLFIVTFRHS